MSAIVIMLLPEKVCIAMDTLSSRGDDKKPHNYASKIYLLPHLRAIMCGTGQVDVIMEWYNVIQRNIIARDFNFLNEMAPPFLIDIWGKYKDQPESFTTVYHFGYDIKEKKFAGYVFRSTNQFKPEMLNYGMAIKPPEISRDELLANVDPKPDPINVIIKIFKRLKQIEDNKDISERVCIGGEIQLAISEKSNTQYILTIYRFNDFDKKFAEMLEIARQTWKKNFVEYLKKAVKNLIRS